MVGRDEPEDLSDLVDDPVVWDVESGEIAGDARPWLDAATPMGPWSGQRNNAWVDRQLSSPPAARRRARLRVVVPLWLMLGVCVTVLLVKLVSIVV